MKKYTKQQIEEAMRKALAEETELTESEEELVTLFCSSILAHLE